MVAFLFPPPVIGVGAPSYVGFQSSSSDLSTYTFTGWTLKRGLHVICLSGNSASTLPTVSVTVGGSAASAVVVQSGSNQTVAGIYTFNVPSDGTYSIVATSNVTLQRLGCGVYDATGMSATAVDTAALGGNTAVTSRTVNVDVPANGVLIAVAFAGFGPGAHSPSLSAGISTTRTNADIETDDNALIGDTYPTTAESNRTVTASTNVACLMGIAAASFQP